MINIFTKKNLARAILIGIGISILVLFEMLYWSLGIWYIPPMAIGIVVTLNWVIVHSGWI